MANICSNTFYAYSEYPKNLETIKKFFEDWDAEVELDEDHVDVYFNSKWEFPAKEMNELYESLPSKEDIFIRCLSTELSNDYVAYYKCDENGWYSALLGDIC